MTFKRSIRIDGEIAYVPLTRGYEAIIDAADVSLVERYSWTALVKRKTVYAKRAEQVDGRTVTIRMHRVIAGVGEGVLVDHRDGNGLNNRRRNLRGADNSQNLCNRGLQQNNTSGITGVTWNKAAGKWQAQIKHRGKVKYLGLYEAVEDARLARARAAASAHGEFAWGAENGVEFHEPNSEEAAA